jgi:predicted lipid-binding transport protein (Tim44 family)
VKGRPILGAITGFLFGLFLGITLFLYGVIPLSSDMLWILPLLGILLGLIMAAWAPFGKSAEPAPIPASAPAPVAATSEEASTDATEDDASDEEKAAGDESAANEEATAEPTAE